VRRGDEGGRRRVDGSSWQTGAMARSITQLHWFPRNEPQTLQIAVILLYWNAFFGFLFGILAGGRGVGAVLLLLLIADIAGGYGVANERKWGYLVALLASLAPLALLVEFGYFRGVLNIIFEIALVVLLVHPMSRSYYKIWFR
jgi:hypothetical protein